MGASNGHRAHASSFRATRAATTPSPTRLSSVDSGRSMPLCACGAIADDAVHRHPGARFADLTGPPRGRCRPLPSPRLDDAGARPRASMGATSALHPRVAPVRVRCAVGAPESVDDRHDVQPARESEGDVPCREDRHALHPQRIEWRDVASSTADQSANRRCWATRAGLSAKPLTHPTLTRFGALRALCLARSCLEPARFRAREHQLRAGRRFPRMSRAIRGATPRRWRACKRAGSVIPASLLRAHETARMGEIRGRLTLLMWPKPSTPRSSNTIANVKKPGPALDNEHP